MATLGIYVENMDNSLGTDESHRFITLNHKSTKYNLFISNYEEENAELGISLGQGYVKLSFGKKRYQFGYGWWE